MKSKLVKSKLLYIFITLFLLVIMIIGGRGIIPAFADNAGYSNVLADLRKDENFSFDDYPYNEEDYSIKVIQVAESETGDLYVYTYQPCQMSKQLIATQINMSFSETVDGTALYDLVYINSSDVFAKYLVKGVAVGIETVRYYNITSIYRKYDSDMDANSGVTSSGNTVNEIAYKVGQLWTVSTVDGKVVYSKTEINVVIIKPEQKYVGMLRYNGGFIPFLGTYDNCDSHYVAFDCNYQIDELYSADITYKQQRYQMIESITVQKHKVGDSEEKLVPLKGVDTGEYQGGGLNGLHKYEWKRIERVSDFINDADNNLSSAVKENLKDKQWVLRFTETDWDKYNGALGSIITEYSEVSEVSILRLEFKSAGKVYNLGVVDGKQTGSGIPDNEGSKTGFWAYIWQCIVRLFNGTATLSERFVAIITLIVCVMLLFLLFVLLVLIGKAFIKLFAWQAPKKSTTPKTAPPRSTKNSKPKKKN